MILMVLGMPINQYHIKMKTGILKWSLGLVLIFGCSTERIDEIEIVEDPRNPVFEIVFQESGSYRMVTNGECEDLEQADLTGVTNQTVFGIFTTKTRLCTDFQDIYEVKGRHTLANGDSINFTVEDWFVEGELIKFVYKYEGGSGAFDGATGELTVTHKPIALDDSRASTYINTASGYIKLAIN
ncbi:MAG: hypothetical protein KJP09_11185 [Bacteroidia bacterium]|nr:hypothetical protein [Bacteroidia bacterium]NND12082.1 hypothetical protein [Flavobacteriaceae bacterium]MBT8311016.1 hypothetical protein [Bacteroidia bacterium]NNK26608.1 hypothetical protein [Flavobacteriaceae bacterium]NNL61093.1 hypothetical protein [Flavobacteriaceae bacterium]